MTHAGSLGEHLAGANPTEFQLAMAARSAALAPGGPLAQRFFARHPTVLQIGSTVFVHAGVLPCHAEYGLERINKCGRLSMPGH